MAKKSKKRKFSAKHLAALRAAHKARRGKPRKVKGKKRGRPPGTTKIKHPETTDVLPKLDMDFRNHLAGMVNNNIKVKCLELAVNSRLQEQIDDNVVAAAQKYFDFVTGKSETKEIQPVPVDVLKATQTPNKET